MNSIIGKKKKLNLFYRKAKDKNLLDMFSLVLKEINQIKSVWCSPSDKLLDLCKDAGTIQFGHTDLEKLISNDNKEFERIVYETCFKNRCGNCVGLGFPCLNACIYGNFNKKLMQFWSIN